MDHRENWSGSWQGSKVQEANMACWCHTQPLAPVIASLKTMNADKSMVVQLQSCLHFPFPFMQ
jgi:hypothetical protein